MQKNSQFIPNLTLVLGGARSGKSAWAERATRDAGANRAYIATATAGDAEMASRIARHRSERGAGWLTVEEPLDLAKAIAGLPQDHAALIDCLTLWLTNRYFAAEAEGRDPAALLSNWVVEVLSAITAHPAPVIAVSNEIGMGLVPDTPLGRAFRDAQGRLNQQVAAAAGQVVFVAAGLPLALKGDLPVTAP